jgi:hypothetical protein
MKNIIVAAALALAGGAHTVSPPPQQSAPVASTAPVNDGLSDLAAMTFGCPAAALNAAAREAAKAPAQGTYQFSYFKLINDSHHAAYEVHFKSNYQDEAELQYCVTIYCQQGWDPKTTRPSVSLMPSRRQPGKAGGHLDACQPKAAPVTRQKR